MYFLESFCWLTTFFSSVYWNMWVAVIFQVSECTRSALQQKMPLLMQDLPGHTIPVAFLLCLEIKLDVQKDAFK